ncbi:MAG TPA: PRC-barrel domain-containing protein [Noviherbaspirillum sp.]|uniref:PRC-barrel domain-containing protein n=1 Tax=Noviherbaspirillum sp. TaxID=1926288 RepID=UPI002B4A9BEE|nr:PRC-barrel domain-containing protein [Noviherbaspirillum sp.]HJV86044.1 PRC-barrel domain-containing protein [Noviherbaspirillum sp.]
MKAMLRVALLLLAGVGAGAYAQHPVGAGSMMAAQAQHGNSARQQHLYRASKIVGAKVRNQREEKVGVIKDLVLDSRRGEIAYAVVRFEGSVAATGAGKKLHPIPWRALQASDDGTYYILQTDRETLTHAPGFDRKHWPDMADQRWSDDVDRFWDRMVGRGNSGNNNLTSGGTLPAARGAGAGAPSAPAR